MCLYINKYFNKIKIQNKNLFIKITLFFIFLNKNNIFFYIKTNFYYIKNNFIKIF